MKAVLRGRCVCAKCDRFSGDGGVQRGMGQTRQSALAGGNRRTCGLGEAGPWLSQAPIRFDVGSTASLRQSVADLDAMTLVLVGCSGGADSLTLAYLAAQTAQRGLIARARLSSTTNCRQAPMSSRRAADACHALAALLGWFALGCSKGRVRVGWKLQREMPAGAHWCPPRIITMLAPLVRAHSATTRLRPCCWGLPADPVAGRLPR